MNKKISVEEKEPKDMAFQQLGIYVWEKGQKVMIPFPRR